MSFRCLPTRLRSLQLCRLCLLCLSVSARGAPYLIALTFAARLADDLRTARLTFINANTRAQVRYVFDYLAGSGRAHLGAGLGCTNNIIAGLCRCAAALSASNLVPLPACAAAARVREQLAAERSSGSGGRAVERSSGRGSVRPS